MALTVWFYVHMHGNVPAFVYDPSFKLVDKEAFPRVLKWGTRNYKHEGTYKPLLNVNGLFQSLSCLQPISNEESSYISPLEEGSTPEVRASTPVREASTPITKASTPLAAKDRENQQLREQVGLLEELLSLREGCSVGEDTTVQFEDPISEMGPEPHVEVQKRTKKPGPSVRTQFVVTYKRRKR
ncbi:hypothetical protein H6P81_010080 [Aristolochia fimbriata]|uniref:Uncharacterized protein n=1 Tax=Aristolochia fimbriata TaxID=158543 RepID=A0AAV7EPW2_ARIFI|nr:hypothetical protein H6P81_010080 [Aristolochia fimbriata]